MVNFLVEDDALGIANRILDVVVGGELGNALQLEMASGGGNIGDVQGAVNIG
jgi:hypothetical protein